MHGWHTYSPLPLPRGHTPLPPQATFHAAAPAALASLRLHLGCPLAHGPAAVLLRSLDFAPALAKVGRLECVWVGGW